MNIQLFPALNGDCILVEHAPGHYFLIDGGYVDTYKNFLTPKLREIAAAGGVIDVLVVTHIDGDHISGIIKMMEGRLLVPVKEIWYNGYRHIQSTAPVSREKEDFKHKDICKEANVPLISPMSARQGCTLSTLITRQGISWNGPSGGAVMMAPMSFRVGDTTVHVLSPNKGDIEDLENYWKKSLIKDKLLDKEHSEEYWDDAFEFSLSKEEAGFQAHVDSPQLATRSIKPRGNDVKSALEERYTPDSSAANGSSISFVLESGGRRVLFLGDAHAETIIESLQALYGEESKPYRFDAVKLSHHGSFNNNSPALFDLITTDKWLVSTNGDKFNHPDLPTMAHIVTRGEKNRIYFNYDLPICEKLRQEPAHETYDFEVITPEGKDGIQLALEAVDGADGRPSQTEWDIAELRSLTESQVSDVLSLMSELDPDITVTPEMVRQAVDESGMHFFAAVEADGTGSGRIIGCASLCVFGSPTGRKASVEDVVVTSSCREQGIGRALMEHLIDYARRELAPIDLHLTSRPERTAANELYASLGFQLRETNVYKMELALPVAAEVGTEEMKPKVRLERPTGRKFKKKFPELKLPDKPVK